MEPISEGYDFIFQFVHISSNGFALGKVHVPPFSNLAHQPFFILPQLSLDRSDDLLCKVIIVIVEFLQDPSIVRLDHFPHEAVLPVNFIQNFGQLINTLDLGFQIFRIDGITGGLDSRNVVSLWRPNSVLTSAYSHIVSLINISLFVKSFFFNYGSSELLAVPGRRRDVILVHVVPDIAFHLLLGFGFIFNLI